jgi:hypothetical protein
VDVAQTNIQLYNQLRSKDWPLDDLVLVHRAYELLTTLYPGYYQADGKTFVAHGVGVASILGWIDQPAEIVAVGMLHNVYGNADFGDGRAAGVTPARSRVVRTAMGERIEGLIVRFRQLRIRPETLESIRASLPEMDDVDRRLILVELADQLEKYVDLGVLYYGNNDWVLGNGSLVPELVAIAGELGQPLLGEKLAEAYAAATATDVPAELRSPDGRRYLKLVVPRSCRRRIGPRLRARMSRLHGELRPSTRLRRLVGGLRTNP